MKKATLSAVSFPFLLGIRMLASQLPLLTSLAQKAIKANTYLLCLQSYLEFCPKLLPLLRKKNVLEHSV